MIASFTPLQVYTELEEAIAVTQAALDDLQSTEALERSQQGTTDLATESAPAFEASAFPLVANPITVNHIPIICAELPWTQADRA